MRSRVEGLRVSRLPTGLACSRRRGVAAFAFLTSIGLFGCSSEPEQNAGRESSAGSAGASSAGSGNSQAGAAGASTEGGAGGGGGTQATALSPLRARGKDIVDEAGNVVVLRGFGLGGWLFPEGYMIGSPGGAASPREFRAAVEAKIGKEKTDAFFKAYEDHYVTRSDIQAIATWGFNAVRLALNANSLMPEAGQPSAAPYNYNESAFARIDQLVEWCSDAGVYVILDMHGAPGAQNTHNISDSDGRALLWDEPDTYWPRTIALWQKLASRYRESRAVIGYDLLNEPQVPGSEKPGTNDSNGPWTNHDNRPLRNLYIAITEALRNASDQKIVFVEAGFWALNFKDLTPPWDDNLVYSFHYYPPPIDNGYFTGTDTGPSFEPVFNSDVPLWVGETGEWNQTHLKTREAWNDHNAKFVAFMKTLNKGHAVSWSWWTTKKFARGTQPWECHFPAEYSALLANWNGASAAEAETALMQMAEALRTETCTFHSDLVSALGGTP